MAFAKKKEEVKEKISFNKLQHSEIVFLEKEIKEFGGEIKWLQKKGAISVRKNQEIAVIMDNSGYTKYIELSDKVRQVYDYIAYKENAERERIFQQTGEYPVSKFIKNINLKIKK